MLAILQIPFADARPFLLSDTGRLAKPTWFRLEPGRQFVRSLGVARRRPGGGSTIWPSEQSYCDASRAIRFPIEDGRSVLHANAKRPMNCVFRRFFCDGLAMMRLEIGLKLEDQKNIGRIVHEVMSLPVNIPKPCIPTPGGRHISRPTPNKPEVSRHTLGTCGNALAQLLVASTTQRNGRGERWWIRPGFPMLLLEFEHGQNAPRLRGDLLRGLNIPPHYRFQVQSTPLLYNGMPLTTWLIRRRDYADVDAMRRIRIDLSRLHAERESMRQILIHLDEKNITIRRGAEPSERLQRFLADVSKVFFAKKRYGFNQSEILRLAYSLDDLVTAGERLGVERALRDARKTVKDKVGRSIKAKNPRTAQPGTIINAFNSPFSVGRGVMTMANYDNRVDIEQVHVSGGNVTIAHEIGKIRNRIAEAAVDDALAKKLDDLTAEVTKLSGLTDGQASDVARDLDAFVEKATDPHPSGSTIKRFADRLIETLKTVGEVAQPIIGAVGAIAGLF